MASRKHPTEEACEKLIKLEQDLLRTREWAEKKYRRSRNVVGVAAGTKYEGGNRTNNTFAIHFYVTRKTKSGKPLPKFIYGRFKNGKINRRQRFYTDVIATGRIVSSCGSGSDIRRTGSAGAITLLFQNKMPADKDFYVITCAHVAGSLSNPSYPYRELTSNCCPNANPFATRVYNSINQNNRVKYDIALAKLVPAAVPQTEHLVAGVQRPVTLTGFFSRSDIRPGLNVHCAFPVSMQVSGIVDSYAGTVYVQIGSEFYDIENAYLLRISVMPGDSGGLIYKDTLCVGMLFARSDNGWAWFHPFEDAVQYLESQSGIKINPF